MYSTKAENYLRILGGKARITKKSPFSPLGGDLDDGDSPIIGLAIPDSSHYTCVSGSGVKRRGSTILYSGHYVCVSPISDPVRDTNRGAGDLTLSPPHGNRTDNVARLQGAITNMLIPTAGQGKPHHIMAAPNPTRAGESASATPGTSDSVERSVTTDRDSLASAQQQSRRETTANGILYQRLLPLSQHRNSGRLM